MSGKLCFIFLVATVFFPAFAEGKPALPFQPGEKLTFQVRWGFIAAGEAVLEVMPREEIDGAEANRFGLSVSTYPAIDIFYKVRDRIDSFTDGDLTRSLYYTRKTEGRRLKEERVILDWEAGKARYSNFDEERSPVPIKPGTFDPFSVFYAFRLQELREDETMVHPVTDGRRLVAGHATVGRRTRIQTAMGSIDTFVVEISMEDIDGTFEKEGRAGLQIWVSADRHRIPVRVRSRVAVGSFVAELTDVSGSDWPQAAVRNRWGGNDYSRSP